MFSEVRRVLKPGGIFVVSFSNRCFAAKAVWVWLFTDDEKRRMLVTDYFRRAGFVKVAEEAYTPDEADPLYVVSGCKRRR